MFASADYQRMYDRFLGPLSQPVLFKVNNGTGFDDAETVNAHVSNWRESELVPNGSIKIGDLRLIILEPPRVLGLKDRIEIEGRSYAIVQWDDNTRTVGATKIAAQVTVRG
jgi:hypothetical protein